MKCLFCNDFFQLCLPKKNLDANLMNCLSGTKHTKCTDDAVNPILQEQASALSTGKRGRPSRVRWNALGEQQGSMVVYCVMTGPIPSQC